MLKGHMISMIRENLGHQPTIGQEELIGKLADFIMEDNEKKAFIVKGYAGTGKTTLVSAVVRTLEHWKIKSLLLAPTGQGCQGILIICRKTCLYHSPENIQAKIINGWIRSFCSE